MSARVDEEVVGRAIIAELCVVLNSKLPQAAVLAKRGFGDAVRRLVKGSPEYYSLSGGRLQAELGLVSPAASVGGVVDAIADSMEVTVHACTPTGPFSLNGGFSIALLRPDLSDALGAPQASFQSNAFRVDWLDWLLLSGDRVVVEDYEFVPGDLPGSRTGLGIMRRSRGSGWGVPAEYAGTSSDNFITRALAPLNREAEGIVAAALSAVF